MEKQILNCYEKGYSTMLIRADSRKVQQSRHQPITLAQHHRYTQ
jgi:hypothetical protein